MVYFYHLLHPALAAKRFDVETAIESYVDEAREHVKSYVYLLAWVPAGFVTNESGDMAQQCFWCVDYLFL